MTWFWKIHGLSVELPYRLMGEDAGRTVVLSSASSRNPR